MDMSTDINNTISHKYDLRSSSSKRKSVHRQSYINSHSRKRRKTEKRLFINSSLQLEPKEELLLPQFDLLPNHIWQTVLRFLPVRDIEMLACTCSSLNSLIKGSFITTLDFPFHSSFLTELTSENVIEKKPLLRLRCKKSRSRVCPMAYSSHTTVGFGPEVDQSMHWLMMETTYPLSAYLANTQMSLLQLSMLRELDLVPQSFRGAYNLGELNDAEVAQYLLFDRMIFDRLDSSKILPNLSRLAVLQDHEMLLGNHVRKMSSLIDLQIYIMTRDNLKKPSISSYIRGLESVVVGCRAKSLKIVVIRETRRKLHKMLCNSVIERLHISGPCTFNALLYMQNLKEVTYEPLYLFDRFHETEKCHHWTTRPGDRSIHREGLCCVDFSPVLKWCPVLETFGTISLLNIVGRKEEDKWLAEVKKRFFRKFISIGGDLPMSKWTKKFWVKKNHVRNPADMRWT